MYLLRQAGNKDGILGQSVLISQADVSKKAGRIFLKQTEELSLCSDSGRKDGNTMRSFIRNIGADSSRTGPKHVNTSETL